MQYNSILISFIVLFLYFGSYYLVTLEVIKLISHRKFWNVVLLISFLISGILGLILAISVDNKLNIDWYSGMLWWHVEAGIVMAIISIFHAFWHVKYYLKMIKK